MAQSGELVRLEATQKERAVGLLVKTYSEDAGYRYVWPKKDERTGALRRHLGANLTYAMVSGDVYVTPQLNGVVCWLPPMRAITSAFYLLRTGFGVSRAMMSFSHESQERLVALVQYNDAVRKRAAPGRHWYLGLLGVERPAQFQATATRLLQPHLQRVDAAKQSCYLETANRSQVTCFQTLGFELVNEGQVPKSNVTVWAMLRRPRDTNLLTETT
jgi:hypothetical protein